MSDVCTFSKINHGDTFEFENRLYRKTCDEHAELIKDEFGYQSITPRIQRFYPEDDVTSGMSIDGSTTPNVLQ